MKETKMKKVMLTLACVLFAASSVSAMPLALDPSALDTVLTVNGAADASWSGFTATDVGYGLDITADTTSTIVNPATGAFNDVGHVAVTNMLYDGLGSSNGLNSSWALVGEWTDLTGNSGPGGITYNPGATLTMYAFQAVNGSYDFGGPNAPGVEDDSGFSALDLSSANAVKVAELQFINGKVGGDAGGVGVSLDLYWQYTYLAQGFWLDGDGNPLSLADLDSGEYLQFFADANTSLYDEITNPGVIYARHHIDGLVDVVPEPATMALFGTGLFGLAGAGLRRKKA